MYGAAFSGVSQRVEAQHIALDERRALVPHTKVAILLYSWRSRRAVGLLPVLKSKLEIIRRLQIVRPESAREESLNRALRRGFDASRCFTFRQSLRKRAAFRRFHHRVFELWKIRLQLFAEHVVTRNHDHRNP